MNKLHRYQYKFIIWTEDGTRHAGSGYILGESKNDAARKAKLKISADLKLPPHDVNVNYIKGVGRS